MIRSPFAAASLGAALVLAAGIWAPQAEAAGSVSVASKRVTPTRVKGSGRVTVTVKLKVVRATVSSVAVRAQVARAATAPSTTLNTIGANLYSGQISVPVNTTSKVMFADVIVTITSSAGTKTQKLARVRIDPGGDPNAPPPPPDI